VGIVNQEALAERARQLYTIPSAIDVPAFGSLNAAHKAALEPAFYTFSVADNLHRLNVQFPHLLNDTQRYTILEGLELANGVKSVEVKQVTNTNAQLEVHFFNQNYLSQILLDSVARPDAVKTMIPITGGHRTPAGPATGQVQVTQISALADPAALSLVIAPVGDYSTYKIGVDTVAYPRFDPVFNDIPFRFRPGCFSTNCAPEWKPGVERKPVPVIDYLTKDYDSFRHTMITAMMTRVPNWDVTSEADLDQVLLDLFSAAADELSDYQDRVMNEAYLATARKRVSLARHARLMDYHIHQGNQASTWVALEAVITPPAPIEFDLQTGLEFWAGAEKEDDAAAVVFVAKNDEPVHIHKLFSRLGLYTWSNAIPSLEAGSTTADLRIIDPNPLEDNAANATVIQNLIRAGKIKRLLIQEYLNPVTGTVNGRDPNKRQLVRLISGNPIPGDPNDKAARAMLDPVTGKSFVRVNWRDEDKLRSNYCFTVECPQRVEDVSLFHGNLVEVFHGRPTRTPIVFKEPGAQLNAANEFYYELTGWGDDPTRWGTICRLPQTKSPLAYCSTPPGGDIAPISTLTVTVAPGGTEPWIEVPNLIHSDTSDENGNHFVVETDENGESLIRFGNGTNGKTLPEHVVVSCDFQYGAGLSGNIGLDRIENFEPTTLISNPAGGKFSRCWNPFDVSNGRAQEPAAEIVRRVPEAYRARQLRAVTLQDYVNRAQEVTGVSRAAASYAWTGSWRTVRITIDPVGSTELDDALRRDVASYLAAVRLIGEDLEIRPPLFVPLDIHVALCADPDYWPQDLRFILEQEFSAGFTPDGRMGFFHPDRWTFGQPLHASQILGRIQQVQGVEHVISIELQRWNEQAPPTEKITKLRPNEIIEVMSDPGHMELGFISFAVQGGRQ
jgi:hypothetical protein